MVKSIFLEMIHVLYSWIKIYKKENNFFNKNGISNDNADKYKCWKQLQPLNPIKSINAR